MLINRIRSSSLIIGTCVTAIFWICGQTYATPPFYLDSFLAAEEDPAPTIDLASRQTSDEIDGVVGGETLVAPPSVAAGSIAPTNPDQLFDGRCYEWQVLPVGLMYKAYLAGEKESRMATVFNAAAGRSGAVWENTLGAHVGLLRYGTNDAVNPQGWQFDLEGAAMPRVDMGHEDDLEAVDFRAGWLVTHRRGPNAFKAGYYHLSSHVGDEFLIRNVGFERINYVRDSLIVGWTRDLFTPDLQIYGEVAWALYAQDGAKPLELQYGIQYSPLVFGLRGAPFAAVNGHTRQDFNYITSINAQVGWQWRGASNHTLRTGFQYYEGPALQWSFVGQSERMVGAGIWFDF